MDVLFAHRGAVSTFIQFLSHQSRDDGIVVAFGRADAWITACSVLLTLPDGKVGKRNTQFKDTFRYLFPRDL